MKVGEIVKVGQRRWLKRLIETGLRDRSERGGYQNEGDEQDNI